MPYLGPAGSAPPCCTCPWLLAGSGCSQSRQRGKQGRKEGRGGGFAPTLASPPSSGSSGSSSQPPLSQRAEQGPTGQTSPGRPAWGAGDRPASVPEPWDSAQWSCLLSLSHPTHPQFSLPFTGPISPALSPHPPTFQASMCPVHSTQPCGSRVPHFSTHRHPHSLSPKARCFLCLSPPQPARFPGTEVSTLGKCDTS